MKGVLLRDFFNTHACYRQQTIENSNLGNCVSCPEQELLVNVVQHPDAAGHF